jgi:hypothetical protein
LRFGHAWSTSNKVGLLAYIIFHIEQKVDPDEFVILWRLGPFLTQNVEGIIFVDLIHFSANSKFPEVIVVVLVYLKRTFVSTKKENAKLVDRTMPFGMKLGLFAHPGKLDCARGDVLK